MEIRHIECFLAVARYKNFRKASEAVHLSQPSISRSIKELEEELGCMLFVRTTNFVRLTDAGEKIVSDCENIMRSLENIEKLKNDEDEGESGHFILGIPPLTALTSFTGILLAFQLEYPNIHIDLMENGPKTLEKMLNRRIIDIGMFTPEEDDPYERIWFEDDHHDIVMSSYNDLSDKKILTYRDLNGSDIVIYTSDYKLHDAILSHFARAGSVPASVMETIQLELMLDMARTGGRIAFIPHKKTLRLTSELTAIPIDDDSLRLRLAFTWLRSSELQPCAVTFLNFVKDYLGIREK